MRVKAVLLSDITRDDGWAPIRRAMGVQSFGINAWTAAEAGGRLIPGHDEVPTGHEELYLVTAGHAAFTVDGEEIDAPAGALVLVADPASTRAAVAKEAGTTVVSMGGKPGEAYEPQAWEVNADVFALFDEGRFAEARALLEAALEEYPGHGILHFNLACAEAQLGETDAALEHLREGVRERPDLAAAARDDHDLEPISSDPRFSQIVGGGR